MRHLIGVKVTVVDNEINNRTKFDLYVAGFKAVESFPLPPLAIRIKHAIKVGAPALYYRIFGKITSTVEIGATLTELSTTLSGFIKSVVRLKQEANIKMRMHFADVIVHATKVSAKITNNIREMLNLGALSSSPKIIQTASNIRTALFMLLKQWDYKNPDGDLSDTSNRYLLSDLDSKQLSIMDKKG